MRPVTMQQSRTDYIPETRTRQTNLVRPIIPVPQPVPVAVPIPYCVRVVQTGCRRR